MPMRWSTASTTSGSARWRVANSGDAADRTGQRRWGTLTDRVRLPEPSAEHAVQLRQLDDAELMHEQALRVRVGSPDTRILDLTLEVEVAVESCLSRLEPGEAAAASLQRDRRLRDRVREQSAFLGELDEAAIEGD